MKSASVNERLLRLGAPASLPASSRSEEPAGRDAGAPRAARRPLVIGHRGLCSLAPENTLSSFQRAVAAGADLVELDYPHSLDGVPVGIHDAELDRTPDARKSWKESQVKVWAKSGCPSQSRDTGR